MSRPLRGGLDAIRIAQIAAKEAGLAFPTVSGATKEGESWIVNVTSANGNFTAVIAETSGEITEWKRISR